MSSSLPCEACLYIRASGLRCQTRTTRRARSRRNIVRQWCSAGAAKRCQVLKLANLKPPSCTWSFGRSNVCSSISSIGASRNHRYHRVEGSSIRTAAISSQRGFPQQLRILKRHVDLTAPPPLAKMTCMRSVCSRWRRHLLPEKLQWFSFVAVWPSQNHDLWAPQRSTITLSVPIGHCRFVFQHRELGCLQSVCRGSAKQVWCDAACCKMTDAKTHKELKAVIKARTVHHCVLVVARLTVQTLVALDFMRALDCCTRPLAKQFDIK